MMQTTDAPKRRWFRWSLRTMFVVVTLFCCWLGYYCNWQHERREALIWLDAHGTGGFWSWKNQTRPPLPWMLKMLGEKPQDQIFISYNGSKNLGGPPPPEYERLVDRIVRLFPEAQVIDQNKPESLRDFGFTFESGPAPANPPVPGTR